ncbi:MAG: hypothetical protein ACR2NX_14410 [Chthoniobacterales bacterium]
MPFAREIESEGLRFRAENVPFLVGLLGLPWVVLIPFHDALLSDELRRPLATSPGLWSAFGSIVAGKFGKRMPIDYDAVPKAELKQRVRWDVYLLVLRAPASSCWRSIFFTLF